MLGIGIAGGLVLFVLLLASTAMAVIGLIGVFGASPWRCPDCGHLTIGSTRGDHHCGHCHRAQVLHSTTAAIHLPRVRQVPHRHR